MGVTQTTLTKLIDSAASSLIGSIDESDFPNVKAMLKPRLRHGLKEFFFTTNTSSMRVKQYLAQDKACIYFYDGMSFQGVMLKGTMEVLQDEASKQLIWQDGDDMYYPLGVTDPDYCVLKFTALSGRYYANFHSEEFPVE